MARHFFAALVRNTISLIGTALAVASLTLFITLFVVQSLGLEGGAYLGIFTFIFLPIIFLTGLILIPIGIRRQHKLEAESKGSSAHFPVFDLNHEKTRKGIIIFVALTLFNIVVLAAATFEAVEVMDSTAFCGTVCHTVMQPEYTAHQRSPHARVDCADCHIGPGAEWFVKAKISGSWQLIAVALDLYPTPIPTPIHNLRPARETCEQCHWPTKHASDTLQVKSVYKDDEPNTELKTAVLLKVGGKAGRDFTGIHWHVSRDVEIRFQSNESREKIYQLEMTKPDGSVIVYKSNEEAPEDANHFRIMDCVDCHNRPTHRYDLPDDAVDGAMANGLIDSSLPFVKRESMRVLQGGYDSHEAAAAQIEQEITNYYQEAYPEIAAEKAPQITQAVAELNEIYSSNVFPAMKVDWGTYPDHSGHDGCFRCHGRLKTEEGEGIPRNCGFCHSVLAWEEQDPEILRTINP
jgi:hypothetical protein